MPLVIVALIATLAVQVVISAAGLAGPVLAPIAARDLGLDPALVGFFVSMIYGVAAIAGLASGGLIARWGAMRVSQACLVFAAFAAGLIAIGRPMSVIAGALLMGLAYGPATPASSHILSRVAPRAWMNLVFSAKQTGVPLGNALAGAAIPSLALAFGWRGALVFVALVCMALAAIVQPLRGRFDEERSTHPPLFGWAQFVGPLGFVWRDPALRRLAVSSFAYSGMQVTLSAFLVTYLNHALDLSVVAAGLMLSSAQAAGVAGRVLWGWVADRFVDPRRVLGGLGLGMTLFAILTGLFTPAWPQVAMLAICICFGGTAVAWNGVFLAQVARLSPPGRAGEVTGGTSFLTFGGVMATPAIFSLILAMTGNYLVGFTVAAVLSCIGALSYFVAANRDGVRRL